MSDITSTPSATIETASFTPLAETGLADQARFDGVGAKPFAGEPGDADAREGDQAVLTTNARRHADHRETGGGLRVLLIMRAGAGNFERNQDRGDKFAGLECGGEGVESEILVMPFRARRRARSTAHARFESEQRRGIIGGRIGMRDTAADGADVANLRRRRSMQRRQRATDTPPEPAARIRARSA